MAFNLGDIFVTLKAKTGELDRGLKNAERRISGFNGTVGKGLAMLVKGTRLAVTGIVSVSAAVAGLILKGGISRALNIEDAQAKLRGLGHDTKAVEKIMKSALASVKGTAFGLDEAATAAASAVAAGVKPGKDLTRYLSLAGDAATIAGVSFGEMGSIFGKVQTQQRAYTQEINMLADRGLPIYQWLQEELGVTQEALREMVAAGEVDSKTYFSAIQKNIGGAALESGKTTRGAWKNMLAAMSRVGEAIVRDIIPRVRDAFGALTKWFDDNSDNIVNVIGQMIESVKEFAEQLIEIGGNIAEYLTPKFGEFLEKLRELAPHLFAFLEIYIKPIASALGTGLVFAIGFLIDALTELLSWLKPVFEWINRNESVVWHVVSALGAYFAAVKLIATYNKFMAFMDGSINAMILFKEKVIAARAQMGLFKVIMGTPFALSIAVGAALLALAQVLRAIKSIKDAYKEVENLRLAQEGQSRAEADAIKGMQHLLKHGTPEQKKRAKNFFEKKSRGFASGTPFAPGGIARINEFGAETAVLPRGTRVITADETRRNEGKGAGNTYVINIKGALARSESELADFIIDGVKAADRRLRSAGKPQIMGGSV